jgi:hypothetical protein
MAFFEDCILSLASLGLNGAVEALALAAGSRQWAAGSIGSIGSRQHWQHWQW